MSHVASSVSRCVCLSVCLADGTTVSCAKTAQPIKILFDRKTHVGQRNLVLDGVRSPDDEGHFWGDNVGMFPPV